MFGQLGRRLVAAVAVSGPLLLRAAPCSVSTASASIGAGGDVRYICPEIIIDPPKVKVAAEEAPAASAQGGSQNHILRPL